MHVEIEILGGSGKNTMFALRMLKYVTRILIFIFNANLQHTFF